jgi:hypothetical protein
MKIQAHDRDSAALHPEGWRCSVWEPGPSILLTPKFPLMKVRLSCCLKIPRHGSMGHDAVELR